MVRALPAGTVGCEPWRRSPRSADASLHRALGPHRRRGRGHREDPRPAAEPPRAGHVLGDVVGALLLQVVQAPPPPPAHRGAARAGRSGRGRRRGRRRRRHRGRLPHREPQPPQRHRALPGRGHGRRRHPPRHLQRGGPPDRADGPAALRPAVRSPQPVDRRGRGERRERLRQLGRRAHRRRRDRLRRHLPGQPARQRVLPRPAAPRAARAGPGIGHRATSPCCSAPPPGATASAAPACWPRPASARRRRTPTSARACRSATPSRRSG